MLFAIPSINRGRDVADSSGSVSGADNSALLQEVLPPTGALHAWARLPSLGTDASGTSHCHVQTAANPGLYFVLFL